MRISVLKQKSQKSWDFCCLGLKKLANDVFDLDTRTHSGTDVC